MTKQKKKDLKDQYQVADLKEYDVMCTHTTAYSSRRIIMGEQWNERIYNKRQVKSTSEVIDTEEEVQLKKPLRRSLKEQLQDKDDLHRYSTSDIQIMSYLLDYQMQLPFNIKRGKNQFWEYRMYHYK